MLARRILLVAFVALVCVAVAVQAGTTTKDQSKHQQQHHKQPAGQSATTVGRASESGGIGIASARGDGFSAEGNRMPFQFDAGSLEMSIRRDEAREKHASLAIKIASLTAPHVGSQFTLLSSPSLLLWSGARPHPESVATPETLANWARITRELEARNYSRPSSHSVRHISKNHKLFDAKSPDGGAYGVDISSFVSEGTWSCLVSSGYSFGIARAWTEGCTVDSEGVHTVANAWAEGVAHVDIYFFPSYGCGTSPAGQVDAAISYMGGIPFGTIWFDVESGGQGAPSDNDAWMQAAVAEAVNQLGSSRVGVYSSAYMWSTVMGNAADLYNYPLWYAHYNGEANFDDFSSFAGWSSPAMKQFQGDASVCGADVDLNWYD